MGPRILYSVRSILRVFIRLQISVTQRASGLFGNRVGDLSLSNVGIHAVRRTHFNLYVAEQRQGRNRRPAQHGRR